jgi:hypothetical protein
VEREHVIIGVFQETDGGIRAGHSKSGGHGVIQVEVRVA